MHPERERERENPKRRLQQKIFAANETPFDQSELLVLHTEVCAKCKATFAMFGFNFQKIEFPALRNCVDIPANVSWP